MTAGKEERKCYCGHIWTFRELEENSRTDGHGHFYYCPQTEDCNDDHCDGLNYIAPEWGNGQLQEAYPRIRKIHLAMKERKRIKELRRKHKPLDTFLKTEV